MVWFELIEVESYSGYKAQEVPRSFFLNHQRRSVKEVLDRLCESGIGRTSPILDYFKVRTEDHKEYILRYNRLFDKWAVLLKDVRETL